MRVLSNNIFIENPFAVEKEQSVIHLSDSDKEDLINEKLAKCNKLKVIKAGNKCIDVKEGDEVLVDIDRLMSAKRITLDKKSYFIIREPDIISIYDKD